MKKDTRNTDSKENKQAELLQMGRRRDSKVWAA